MGRGSLFVAPPRAGLDETCSQIAAGFDRVIYVSCNPETLARDVRLLARTHSIERVAAFEASQEAGKGAFTFRDQMIDMPTLLACKTRLELARQAGLI